LEIFSNGVTENVHFGLAAFTFTNNADAEIYLHCAVKTYAIILIG